MKSCQPTCRRFSTRTPRTAKRPRDRSAGMGRWGWGGPARLASEVEPSRRDDSAGSGAMLHGARYLRLPLSPSLSLTTCTEVQSAAPGRAPDMGAPRGERRGMTDETGCCPRGFEVREVHRDPKTLPCSELFAESAKG